MLHLFVFVVHEPPLLALSLPLFLITPDVSAIAVLVVVALGVPRAGRGVSFILLRRGGLVGHRPVVNEAVLAVTRVATKRGDANKCRRSGGWVRPWVAKACETHEVRVVWMSFLIGTCFDRGNWCSAATVVGELLYGFCIAPE